MSTSIFVPRDQLQRLDTMSPLQAQDTFLDECWYEEKDPDAIPRAAAAQSMAATAAMAVGLRPFPEVAQRVLEVASKPDTSINDLAKLIENDPALASKMIRLANSAYLRRKTECRNLRQAIQRLGFKVIRGLALSVATLDNFSDPWGEGRRIREHCAGAAATIRVLTEEYDRPVRHEAFLCGLLHDFGKLLVQQVGELDYERFRHQTNVVDKHLLERRVLGYDHAVLGGWVLNQWDIPKPVPKVVALHHRSDAAFLDDGPTGRLIAWLMVADELDHHIADGAPAEQAYFDIYSRKPSFVRVGLTAKMIDRVWDSILYEREETLRIFT